MKTMTLRRLRALAVLAALSAAGGTAVAADAPTSWTDTIALKGDLRYRLENIDEAGKEGRYRERIRARLNIEAKPDDQTKVGVGFSTGQADPVSGNQSLGDGLTKKEFRLDLAYVERKLVPERLTLVAGRMKNPFQRIQDLIWDGDLSMDGLALKGVTEPSEDVTLFGNAASIWIQERSAADDTMLYGGQAGARAQLGESASFLLGGSVYQFGNLEGTAPFDWEKKDNAYGNSTRKVPVDATTTNTVYAQAFTEVEGFAELEVFVGGRPLSLHGSYVTNTEADKDNTGYLVGLSYGKAENTGQFEVGWNYREVEKDCVVGAFTDSDHGGGGTDNRGHKVYARYALTQAWSLAGAYFMDEKKLSDPHDYDRFQFDVSVKF